MRSYLSATIWAILFSILAAAGLTWCCFTLGGLAGPLGLDATHQLLDLPKDTIVEIGLALSGGILACCILRMARGHLDFGGGSALENYLCVMMWTLLLFAPFACNCALFLAAAWLLHRFLPEAPAVILSALAVAVSFAWVMFRRTGRGKAAPRPPAGAGAGPQASPPPARRPRLLPRRMKRR